jgi:hypothetical protein
MAKRLRSAQVEHIALDYVERIFNLMNWNAATLHPDVGLDLNVKPSTTAQVAGRYLGNSTCRSKETVYK